MLQQVPWTKVSIIGAVGVSLTAGIYYYLNEKRKKNNFGAGEVRVSSLWIYPVKSCGGIPVKEIRVNRLGFVNDRRWMIIDHEKKFVTIRQYSKLALIQPELLDDEGKPNYDNPTVLRLSAPNMDSIELPFNSDGDIVDVVIWEKTVKAKTVNPKIDAWLSKYLGRDGFRLVSVVSDEKHERPLSKKWDVRNSSKDNIHTAFADAYPLLLASTSSLRDVHNKMDELKLKDMKENKDETKDKEGGFDKPIDILQFRPNIIVSGPDLLPWAEDYWKDVIFTSEEEKDREVEFYVAKACDRCAIPNVNPKSGTLDVKLRVTKALTAFRSGKHLGGTHSKVFFGQNLIQRPSAINKMIKVGDSIEINTAAWKARYC